MSFVDKRLLKAAATAGNKLPLAVGDSVKATYLGYEAKVDERYNKLRYSFKFKLADGSEKIIRTSAGKVLKKMAYIPQGAVLMITKLGESTDTDFDFEVLKAPKTAAQIETVEVEEQPTETEEVVEEEEEDDDEEESDLKPKF